MKDELSRSFVRGSFFSEMHVFNGCKFPVFRCFSTLSSLGKSNP
jgi:hypothetical protein